MRHPTVLYIEDNPNDVLLMRRAWMTTGIRKSFQTVPDGEGAVRYLSGQGQYVHSVEHPMPGLVLLDVLRQACRPLHPMGAE